MDIYSPRGQVAAALAKKEVERINKQYPLRMLLFPDQHPAPFDGMIEVDGVITGAFEIRTRDANVYAGMLNYKGKNYDTLMVTRDKIDKCVAISSALFLKFHLVIRFNNCTLSWQVSDELGNWVISRDTGTVTSRANINGGTAVRENYYIKITHGRKI